MSQASTLTASAFSSVLPNNEPQAQLSVDDSVYHKLGLGCLLLAFGVFGGWAALAPLDSASVASGTVKVESHRKKIQHPDGGIVAEIYVSDGDKVQGGDPLLRLDPTQVKAQLKIVEAQYWAGRAQEGRLLAEQQDLEQIHPMEELSLHQVDEPEINGLLAGEETIFQQRRAALQGELAVLKQRLAQYHEQHKGLQALVQNKKQRLVSYQDEAGDFKTLFDKGYGDNLRLRELERAVLQLQGELDNHYSERVTLQLQIEETRLQRKLLKQKFQESVAGDLQAAQTQLLDLQQRRLALQDTLQHILVVAPVAGEVVGMTVHTLGAVIASGEELMHIVPGKDAFVIEAQLAIADVDQVSAGIMADVRFSAFKAKATQVIEGRVQTISADSFVDEQSGVAYYAVRIKITERGKDQLGGITLQSGMPVEVMIKTGERTLLSYLTRPFTDMFARAFREE